MAALLTGRLERDRTSPSFPHSFMLWGSGWRQQWPFRCGLKSVKVIEDASVAEQNEHVDQARERNRVSPVRSRPERFPGDHANCYGGTRQTRGTACSG